MVQPELVQPRLVQMGGARNATCTSCIATAGERALRDLGLVGDFGLPASEPPAFRPNLRRVEEAEIQLVGGPQRPAFLLRRTERFGRIPWRKRSLKTETFCGTCSELVGEIGKYNFVT